MLAYSDRRRCEMQRSLRVLYELGASRRRDADGRGEAAHGAYSDVPGRADDQGRPGSTAGRREVPGVRGGLGAQLAEWPAEPSVGRVVDGLSGELDELRALGGAVVPAQAELAFRVLWARFCERGGYRMTSDRGVRVEEEHKG